jgi:hypothetical protein
MLTQRDLDLIVEAVNSWTGAATSARPAVMDRLNDD